jgi:hypothetical protein
MSCKGLVGNKLKNCLAQKQKHIVKSKTVISSSGKKNKTTKSLSESTNIESASNRRTMKVSTNSLKNPRGSTSTLVTKKSSTGSGRVILSDDGSWNKFGSKKGQSKVKNFQKVFKKNR